MTKILNQRGISLVSTLVAVAIAGILALSISTLLSNLLQFSSRADRISAIDNLVRAVSTVLDNHQLCSQALYFNGTEINFNGATTNVDRILAGPIAGNINNVTVAKVWAPADGNNWQILPGLVVNGMQLREVVAGSGRSQLTKNNVVFTTYTAELVMQFRTNLAGQHNFGGFRNRTIPVTVTTNGAGAQLECGASSNLAEICEAAGGTYNAATNTCNNAGGVTVLNAASCPACAAAACSAGYTAITPVPIMIGFRRDASTNNRMQVQCSCFRYCKPNPPSNECVTSVCTPSGTATMGPGPGPTGPSLTSGFATSGN